MGIEITALLVLMSWVITITHAVDEVHAPGGPIWEYLVVIKDKPWVFHLFTLGVLLLGSLYVYPPLLWVLIAARLGDVLFTHGVLLYWKRPNPGIRTAALLVIDALFAYAVIQGSIF